MLTTAQQAQIRLYLGYPDLFRYKNYRLEATMTEIDSDAEALVVAALTQLAAIDAKLTSFSLSAAGIRRVDEIEFFAGRTLSDVRRIGRQYVGRISITLGVPIYSDVFGEGGYLGDKFSRGGLGTNKKGMIRLG